MIMNDELIERMKRDLNCSATSQEAVTALQEMQRRIAELSTDLQSYTAMHAVQENEIGRLDAALAALSDPDWWDGETISTAMDFARKARAGE